MGIRRPFRGIKGEKKAEKGRDNLKERVGG